MVSSRRSIARDHQNAGAFHEVVGEKAAVGENTFVTRSGALFAVLRFRGRDGECLDATEQNQRNRCFESGLRVFDENFWLAQYLLKCAAPLLPRTHNAHPVVEEATQNRLDCLASKECPLFVFDTYFVVTYEGLRLKPHGQGLGLKRGILDRLSETKTTHSLTEELSQACR